MRSGATRVRLPPLPRHPRLHRLLPAPQPRTPGRRLAAQHVPVGLVRERRLHMGPMWDFNNGAYHLSGAANPRSISARTSSGIRGSSPTPISSRSTSTDGSSCGAGRMPPPTCSRSPTGSRPTSPRKSPMPRASTSSWTSRLTSMKNFLVQRAKWIDTQYVRPPALSPPPGVRPAGR